MLPPSRCQQTKVRRNHRVTGNSLRNTLLRHDWTRSNRKRSPYANCITSSGSGRQGLQAQRYFADTYLRRQCTGTGLKQSTYPTASFENPSGCFLFPLTPLAPNSLKFNGNSNGRVFSLWVLVRRVSSTCICSVSARKWRHSRYLLAAPSP